jgi:hypothetical protein
MGDKKEQTKQKIAVELEKARLWASFLLPMIGLLCSLIFTEQLFSHFPPARFICGLGISAAIVLVVLMRNENIRRVYAYIEEL